jgi:hypothetical protein
MDSSRFLVMARLRGRHWWAVITYRQQAIRFDLLVAALAARIGSIQLVANGRCTAEPS